MGRFIATSMKKSAVVAMAVASFGAFASTSQAAIVDTTSVNATSATAFDGLISTTDLINQGQTSLTSYTNSFGGSFGFSTARINDGLATTNDGAFLYTGNAPFPETSTYNLNTTATGSTTGYTITNVNVFAGYAGQGALGNQSFQLLVSTVAAPTTFVSLGTFTYTPDNKVDSEATEQALASNTGAIATGVAAVQFIFNDPTAFQAVTGGNTGTLIREADVIGSATVVPEPASLSVLGLGAVGLLRRRRSAR